MSSTLIDFVSDSGLHRLQLLTTEAMRLSVVYSPVGENGAIISGYRVHTTMETISVLR